MDLDKPLDEIIDSKRAERKASRGRGRGAARGGGASGSGRGAAAAGGRGGAARGAGAGGAAASSGPVRNKHSGAAAASGAAGPAAAAGKSVIPLMADGSKIQVSNLPLDVTENQIRDLFTQTVGPVTRVQLSYDKSGKSTGSASIEFKRPNDAQNAYKAYNTRLVDGNRAMKVEIMLDPSRLPPPPLNSRIAPAAVPVKSPTTVTASQRGGAGASRGDARGGARGARGGRGRGRGGKRGDERTKPSEADLDAEMEDYQSKLAA